MDAERKRIALHWQSVLACYGLSYTIERLNYTRNATNGFRPKYAIVTPADRVPSPIIARLVVPIGERTRFGMGWRDRGRNALIFNLNQTFQKFMDALEAHNGKS
jgi:hypothetical protein